MEDRPNFHSQKNKTIQKINKTFPKFQRTTPKISVFTT